MLLKEDAYNVKIKNIEDKLPITNNIEDVFNLASNTALNAKINEIKNKIPSITNLATMAALTTVENKIPSVSNLYKKYYRKKLNYYHQKIVFYEVECILQGMMDFKICLLINQNLTQ